MIKQPQGYENKLATVAATREIKLLRVPETLNRRGWKAGDKVTVDQELAETLIAFGDAEPTESQS